MIIIVGKFDGVDVDSYLIIMVKGGICVLMVIGSLVDI